MLVSGRVALERNFKSLPWFGGLSAQFGMLGECQIWSFLATCSDQTCNNNNSMEKFCTTVPGNTMLSNNVTVYIELYI